MTSLLSVWATIHTAMVPEHISTVKSFGKSHNMASALTATFISPKIMATMANYSLKRTAEGRLRYYHAHAAAAA